jgi:hypothetical protein
MGLLIAHDWKIVGDRATCQLRDLQNDGVQLPRMRNVGGVWKLDVTPSPRPSVEEAKALAEAIERGAQIMQQAARDIEAGRLKTLEQFQSAAREMPRFAESNCVPDVILSLPK